MRQIRFALLAAVLLAAPSPAHADDISSSLVGWIDTVDVPPYSHLPPVIYGWALNCRTGQMPHVFVRFIDASGNQYRWEQGYGIVVNDHRYRPDVLAGLAPYCATIPGSPVLTSSYFGMAIVLERPWQLPLGTFTVYVELSDNLVGLGSVLMPVTITR